MQKLILLASISMMINDVNASEMQPKNNPIKSLNDIRTLKDNVLKEEKSKLKWDCVKKITLNTTSVFAISLIIMNLFTSKKVDFKNFFQPNFLNLSLLLSLLTALITYSDHPFRKNADVIHTAFYDKLTNKISEKDVNHFAILSLIHHSRHDLANIFSKDGSESSKSTFSNNLSKHYEIIEKKTKNLIANEGKVKDKNYFGDYLTLLISFFQTLNKEKKSTKKIIRAQSAVTRKYDDILQIYQLDAE